MAYVNNFERDLDYRNHLVHVYDTQANLTYRYGDDADAPLITQPSKISDFIRHHREHQRPRLVTLNDYYEGRTFIVSRESRRRLESTKADHRASHDFASYIADFTNGYVFGNSVQIAHVKDKVLEAVNDIHNLNDIDAHNRSLGLDLSVYGRAYEYVTKNEDDELRLYKSDARNTFVIYDNSIEQHSIAAIRYWHVDTIDGVDGNQSDNLYYVDVITDQATYYYKTTESANFELTERDKPEPHLFGYVTVTEYSNNENRQGDFEKVLTLIDLYDAAQSDIANYMTDINDAMLLIKGDVDLTDLDVIQAQKEANIFHLVPPVYNSDGIDGAVKEGNVDASYIYKQYDVAGAEAYKNRLSENIHMLTHTPNLSDENFSGNQSGEAMKYKLFGLEQKSTIKESHFRKGLSRRYKLIEVMLKLHNQITADTTLKDLTYTFNRNLPRSRTEELNLFLQAGGTLSQQTLLGMMSFIDDPEQELKRIEDERQREQDNAPGAYPNTFNNPDGKEDTTNTDKRG